MSDERLDNHSSQPAAVDLFCGAGGLSYGMQQAGMTIAGGIDIDAASRHPFPLKPLAMTSDSYTVQSVPHCILDIETAGPITQPPDTYELLLVGVKHEGQHTIFRSNRRDLELFAAFVDGFRGTVVTFNGNRFDLPILSHALQLATGRSLRVSKHYDILSKVEQHAGRPHLFRCLGPRESTHWEIGVGSPAQQRNLAIKPATAYCPQPGGLEPYCETIRDSPKNANQSRSMGRVSFCRWTRSSRRHESRCRSIAVHLWHRALA